MEKKNVSTINIRLSEEIDLKDDWFPPKGVDLSYYEREHLSDIGCSSISIDDSDDL